MRAPIEKRLRSMIFVTVLAAAAGGAVVAQPPDAADRDDAQTGWPGLPPDCWTEPRMIHESESKYDWRAWTTIERVDAPVPDDKQLSPNRAYYYAVASEAPRTAILVFAEKEKLVRISFETSRGLSDIKWINEKLLYLRVWWGRIAATDLVFDVEQERVVLAESVTDGAIAMQQAQETCPRLGGCQCIPKQEGAA